MRPSEPSALIAIFSILVAASAATSRAAAAAPDPCSLLTPAEVSDAFGVAVKAGQPANPTLCSWAAGGKRLTLLITDDKHYAGSKTTGGVPGVTVETLSGIGDEATLTTTGGTFASVMVKKGAVYFMLRVYGFPIDQAKAKEKTLATAAAKRI